MVCCLCSDPASPTAPAGLESVARACSPRVACHGPEAVLFDVEGLSRVCGPPEVIAREVAALAAAEGLAVRIAMAGTMTAAWVLAHARAETTIVSPGGEAAALAPLPLGWLGTVLDLDRPQAAPAGAPGKPAVVPLRRGRRAGRSHFRHAPAPDGMTAGASAGPRPAEAEAHRVAAGMRDRFAILARWGLRTCGDLAALPRADIQARLGPIGVRLHQAACGEDLVPLVPVDEARVFAERQTLEWPIEGLEPLAFVLARQMDRLSTVLERADRGAVEVVTRLTLVTREVHERTLHLPAPMRDARVLRTLVLLDLESHPPAAAIDVVEIRLAVTPGRIVQGSLLARAVPAPEDLSTLLARLGALMGDDRLGAPVVLDSHDSRQVAHVPFAMHWSGESTTRASSAADVVSGRVPFAFRRFALPVAARVVVEHGRPVRVLASARGQAGGAVVGCAGPWRTSGEWWQLDGAGWDRDAWDVELDTGGLYRLARRRTTNTWEIEGAFD
jgi:protein ImuB